MTERTRKEGTFGGDQDGKIPFRDRRLGEGEGGGYTETVPCSRVSLSPLSEI